MNTTRPFHFLTRVVAIVLAFVLALLGLTACGEDVAEGPTAEQCEKLFGYPLAEDAPVGVLVFDASRSRASGGLSSAAADTVRDLSEAKGSITVILVDGEGAQPSKVLESVSLNKADAGTDTGLHQTAVRRSVACIERALAGKSPAAPGTDLGEAIRAAGEYGATVGATEYVIDTDGFSNTGSLNLANQVNEVAIDEVTARLDTAGWNPRFDGATVTFAGIARGYGSVVAAPHADWLRSLYTAICTRTGAAVCDVPVADQALAAGGESERSASPEDADLGLSEVTQETTPEATTVTVPGSLLFAPDSPVLAPDADATLVQVVQCVQAGARVTIRGHAAYVASSLPGEAMELSDLRARAAQDRVIALAGTGADRITTEAYGDTQPIPGAQPADNRRVEFVIEGGC